MPPPTPGQATQQIAQKVVAKRPNVLGNPNRVEVTFGFTLSQKTMERLTARGSRLLISGAPAPLYDAWSA
jgi:hypothetical protein